MAIIDWADVVGRFPALSGKDATEMTSNYITYAVAELEERLGGSFTVPFSSNNLTARDLAIDLTYCKLYRVAAPEKAEAIDKQVSARISALVAGNATMMLIGGTVATVNESAYWISSDNSAIFDTSADTTWRVSTTELNANEEARDD